MSTVMVLNDDEVRLVIKNREHIEYLRLKAEQQGACDHTWRFACHGHNDDAYECTKCGATEWR